MDDKDKFMHDGKENFSNCYNLQKMKHNDRKRKQIGNIAVIFFRNLSEKIKTLN